MDGAHAPGQEVVAVNREERRRMEQAAARAKKRVQGRRTIRGYRLDGKVAFEFQMDDVPDQIRIIAFGDTPEHDELRKQIRSVSDAERLGRLDLIECYLFDRRANPPCYRQQPDGVDRFPESDVEYEFRHDWSKYREMRQRADDIAHLFQDNEIAGLEAVLLAWVLELYETGVDPETGTARTKKMLEETGLLEYWGPQHIAEHWARIPELRRRYEELRAAVPRTAS